MTYILKLLLNRMIQKAGKAFWYFTVGLCCFLGEGGEIIHAQNLELGYPNYQYFTTKDYPATLNNYAFITDNRGILYATNDQFILEYDGTKWQRVIDFGYGTYSVCKNARGQIYVGATDRIGLIRPQNSTNANKLHRIAYDPIDDSIPKECKDFGTVWTCHAQDNYVYFQTDKYIFRWGERDKRFKVLYPRTSFFLSYKVGETIYVLDKDYGLCSVRDDKITLINKGEFFKGEQVANMLPLEGNKILIVTRTKGLFVFDGADITPFQTNIDPLLHTFQVYKAQVFNDGMYVLGTNGAGLLFLDKKGKMVYRLQPPNINLRQIMALFVDEHKNIWVGNGEGIIRFQNPFLLNIHPSIKTDNKLPSTGLEGAVNQVIRFKGKLYVATSAGLFLNQSDDEYKKFTLLDIGSFIKFYEIDNHLYVLKGDQLCEIIGPKVNTVIPSGVLSAYVSELEKNKCFIGSANGIFVYHLINGVLRQTGKLPRYNLRADLISEDPSGVIWAKNGNLDLYRLIPSETNTQKNNSLALPDYKIFKVELSDRKDENINTKEFLNIFGTTCFWVESKIIHQYDSKTNTLIPIQTEWAKDFYDKEIIHFRIANPNEIWMILRRFGEEVTLPYKLSKVNNKITLEKYDLNLLIPEYLLSVYSENNVLWLGAKTALYRLNKDRLASRSKKFGALVNNFKVNDSTIFVGNFWNREGGLELSQQDINIIKIPYRKKNRFRFEWTSTFFAQNEVNEFQYYLEGLDNDWSKWSRNNATEYTNLDAIFFPKTYIFHLRTRNVFGDVSNIYTYQFVIDPPFYLRFWSFVFYGISGIVILILGNRWYVSRLKNEHIARERELKIRVDDATHEANEQREEALRQRDVAEQANANLAQSNTILSQQKQQLDEKTMVLQANLKTIEEQKKSLESQKQELEQKNEILEANNKTIQEQKNALESKTKELEEKYTELAISNQTIAEQREKIANNQKMAALGEITTIVAHEINSPLSAIYGGLQNFKSLLGKVLKGLPAIFDNLDQDRSEDLRKLMDHFNTPQDILSTKEERDYRRKIENRLEDEGFANYEDMAETMTKVGFVKNYDSYLPLLHKLNENSEHWRNAFSVGVIWKQTFMMGESVEKANRIIKALKKYVGDPKSENTEEAVDLAANIQVFLTLYDYHLNQGTSIEHDLQPNLKVWGVPQEIVQIWQTIIMSAVYVANMKAKITLKLYQEGPDAVIIISDKGYPIPPDEVEDVFLPGINSRKTQPEISLSACKLIVDKLNGIISLTVTEDLTNIEIKIPLTK